MAPSPEVEGWVDALRKEITDQKKTMDRIFNDHKRDTKKIMDTMQASLEEKDRVIDILRAQLHKVQQDVNTNSEGLTKLELQLGEVKKQVNDTHDEFKKATPEGEASTARIAGVQEEITRDMEVKLKRWVDIAKQEVIQVAEEENKKKQEASPIPPSTQEGDIIHATLIEERMRRARRFNVRVSGIPETSLEEDGKALCKKLGYQETDPPPYVTSWRAGSDLTRPRALVLRFEDEIKKITFLKKRPLLKGLDGEKIYLDDDLTPKQQEHRKEHMPRVKKAREEGKKAFYRDGRVYIDGKVDP